MKGSCHCGRIQFEATGKPTWTGRCHCKDCQKIGGSAFMAFVGYKKEDVKFTKAKPKEYRSSDKVTRTFCENCGSPIEWRIDSQPTQTNLTLGLFEDSSTFIVKKDIWMEEKASWDPTL